MRIEEEKRQDSEGRERPGTAPAVFCCLLFVGLALIIFFMFRAIQDSTARIAGQESEIMKLTEAVSELEANKPAKEAPKADTPAKSRRNRDTEVAEAFLKFLLTWDTPDDYYKVRNDLVGTYGVPESDPILSVFMPDLSPEQLENVNMGFSKASAYQTGEEGDLIHYFALCDVTNRINGNTGYGRVAVRYTIDGDGGVSQVSAYTLAK